MKIAYLSTFYPYRGGIAQFNACLYRALEKKHEVHAYTFTRQYPDFLFPGRTQLVTSDDIADVVPAERILDSINPLSWQKTASVVRSEKPDLLLMRYWMSYLAPGLGYVAGSVKSKQTRVLSIVDNALPHERKFFDKAFAKYFMKRNDLFIAMSESVKRDILELHPHARILMREHPLYDHFGQQKDKTESRKQLQLSAEKKTILFFGFIRDYKGLDLLIESFGMLSDDYQLVVAGESYGSFDEYRKKIDSLPNKHSVHTFIRYISDAEVPVFFGAADVVCLPYKSATQSGISAIAFHFGKPILVTDVGGLKETIAHGKNGLIIDSPEPLAIAARIREFFSYPPESWQTEILHLKERLSWDNFAEALLDFVRQNQ